MNTNSSNSSNSSISKHYTKSTLTASLKLFVLVCFVQLLLLDTSFTLFTLRLFASEWIDAAAKTSPFAAVFLGTGLWIFSMLRSTQFAISATPGIPLSAVDGSTGPWWLQLAEWLRGWVEQDIPMVPPVGSLPPNVLRRGLFLDFMPTIGPQSRWHYLTMVIGLHAVVIVMQIVSIFLASESYQLLDKYTHLVSTVADTVASNQATASANTAVAATTASTTTTATASTGSTVDAPTSTAAPSTAPDENGQQSQLQTQQPQLPDTFGAIRLMIGISSIMSSLGLQRVSYGFPFDDASQSQNSLWPLGTANDPSISASGNSGDESDDSADSADGSYTDDEYESSVLSEDSTETTDQAPLLPVGGNSSGEVVIGIEPDEPQSQQQQQQQHQRASQTDSGLQTTSNSQAVDKRLRSGIVFDLNWKTMLYAMQHNTTIMNQHQSVNNLLSDLANQPTAQQNPASNVTTSS